MSNAGISRAELQRRLDALRQGTLPESDIYRTVHQFGWQHFLEARVDVERLLTHHKPRLRYIALEVLTTHWNLEEHWETAREVLQHDPDQFNRCLAASCLGRLKRNTGDRRTLSILASVVRDEQEEQGVRLAAYAAMRAVLHYDPQQQWEMLTHEGCTWRKIDWPMVDSYLQHPGHPE